MSRSTALEGDEGLPGNWTDAEQETLLFRSSDPRNTHTLISYCLWCSPFTAALGRTSGPKRLLCFMHCWIGEGALYSWLLPVLPRVHEWITLLVHGDPMASHRNVMENDDRAYWCTASRYQCRLNRSEVWEVKKRGSNANFLSHSLYLIYLFGTRVDWAEKQISVDIFCIQRIYVPPHWQLAS